MHSASFHRLESSLALETVSQKRALENLAIWEDQSAPSFLHVIHKLT